MKSGYRVLLTTTRQHSECNQDLTANYKKFYKLLWDLQIPSKLKIHFLRLIKDYVPHYGNLNKRRLHVDDVYPLCQEVSEDSGHLLWFRSVLRQLWQSLNLFFYCNTNTLDGKTQLVNMFLSVDENTRKLLVISLWSC